MKKKPQLDLSTLEGGDVVVCITDFWEESGFFLKGHTYIIYDVFREDGHVQVWASPNGEWDDEGGLYGEEFSRSFVKLVI